MKFAYDIPDSFWSLFRSMNRELYMEALLKINEEYEYNNYYLSKEVCLHAWFSVRAAYRRDLWTEMGRF